MIRKTFILIVICAVAAESFSVTLNRSRRSVNTCGVSKIKKGLIVQGQSFSRGSFPWIVALTYRGFRPLKFFCAGTLISKTFVVTAAHCILQKHAYEELLPRQILVLFGAHDLEDPYETGRFAFSPKKVILHPLWNPGTTEYDGDLSLLEFEAGNINFNDFVQPICLWNSETEPTVTEGIVTGWGKSENQENLHENVPKMIKVPIQANEDCFLEEKRLIEISSKRTFCAGLRNGSGVCTGDSGGGLFINVNQVNYLKGIVSSSLLIKDGSCDVSKNAVYTNVPKFMDWIAKFTETSRKISCTYEAAYSSLMHRTAQTCQIKDKIESDNYFLAQPNQTSCESFDVQGNKYLKFLPRQISAILPNLKAINVQSCGLTIVRDFYFENMRQVENLYLRENKISKIETNAFKDLVKVLTVNLRGNLLETLDEKVFAKMTSLLYVHLNSNKIKFLSPETFKVPGGRILFITFADNICIHKHYGTHDIPMNELEYDLRSHCSHEIILAPQALKFILLSCFYTSQMNCDVDQRIDDEDFFIPKEPARSDVDCFIIRNNENVKFLPHNIGEKFPNLKEIWTKSLALIVVRNFYFKNLQNLLTLFLDHNKIATVESDAFKDLVKMEKLFLHHNLIETLDENLFATMVALKEVHLEYNKIKFLSPATFKITGGSLEIVNLNDNICIKKVYNNVGELGNLESDLKSNCYQNAEEWLPEAVKNVTFSCFDNGKRCCEVVQNIHSEDYFVPKEPKRSDVAIFIIRSNEYVKFLPKNIGEKFPNLEILWTSYLALTVVRDFHLINMQNLLTLILDYNRIAMIESNAFKNLVKMEKLFLHHNLIETLDENLFTTTVNLKEVYLENNKIKFLGPATFKITGLEIVNLDDNICISKVYNNAEELVKLESDLRTSCP